MPESYRPIHHHPAKPPYMVRDAAKSNMLLVVTCYGCRRCVHFLASDLVEVGMGEHPAQDAPCRCGKCRTREYMSVKLRQVHPGDLGVLIVRRPGTPRQVIDWQDIPL